MYYVHIMNIPRSSMFSIVFHIVSSWTAGAGEVSDGAGEPLPGHCGSAEEAGRGQTLREVRQVGSTR